MKRRTMRSLLALLCVFALLAALLSGCTQDEPAQTGGTEPGPTQGPAQSTEQNTEPEAGPSAAELGYRYTENADGSLTLTGWSGTESVLSIPAALDGKPVSVIGESCFAGLLCLQTVRVPEGVTRLEAYAFECCSALRKIYLPDSLRAIGDGAFSGCAHLTLADMQDGLESIGRGAFLCCDELVQLELPAALRELGDFAFAGCSALASVRFGGDALTALPDRVFCGCTSLSRLKLPEQLRAVGKRAFSGCEHLSNLYFAAPLTELGAYAFENCSGLTSAELTAPEVPSGLFRGCEALNWFNLPEGSERIGAFAFGGTSISDLRIPASVREIEPGAFFQMQGSVTLDEENESYLLLDGSLYTADGKTLLAYFPADPWAEEPQSSFTVPEGVERIAAYALAERGLQELQLPDSLKQIDACALAGIPEEGLTIPAGTVVDPAAFRMPDEAEEPSWEEPGEQSAPEILGSVAGDKNLFREEDYAGFREIANDEFEAWADDYLAYSASQGIALEIGLIPYIMRYKGETVQHFMGMTAVQNRDPDMWAQAAVAFGDDFEQTYLMMDHGLSTELSRGKLKDDLILYSGLYDSQLMAAAGTDTVPTQQQLVEAIGSSFRDPIMISTTTDPGVAAAFGDTLFIIYASHEAVEALGAICIDAVARSSEKEILMNSNACYRILDVGNLAIEKQDPWDPEPVTLYRAYVKVELLLPGDADAD